MVLNVAVSQKEAAAVINPIDSSARTRRLGTVNIVGKTLYASLLTEEDIPLCS
jgi:hypothetical protein